MTAIIGGIDANARPPTDYGQVTGSLRCGEADAPGRQFVDLLAPGLWLPSTFETLHNGPSPTFQHLSGHQHRIDFIAIGGEMMVHSASAEVAEDFDTANSVANQLYRPRFDRTNLCSEAFASMSLLAHARRCWRQKRYHGCVLQDYQTGSGWPVGQGRECGQPPRPVWHGPGRHACLA